jgi:PIN domain nuclease of toxin-antitoxin system
VFKAIRGAREMGRENPGIAVAAITLWELAGLAHSGRLQVAGSVDSYVRETASRVIVRPLTAEIAALAVQMPADFRRIQRTG